MRSYRKDRIGNMEDKRELFVGFDLGNEFSQISCFHPVTGEMESIGIRRGETCYKIPTVVGVTDARKEWLYGDAARRMEEKEEGILIDYLPERIKNGERFNIYGVVFEGSALLERFFRKSLALLQQYYSGSRIDKLVVTAEKPEGRLEEALYQALSDIGLTKERAAVTNYEQAYVNYALSQERSLWTSDVGLFTYEQISQEKENLSYRQKGLSYWQIRINQNTLPAAAGLVKKEFGEKFPYPLPEKKKSAIEKDFDETAEGLFYKNRVTTLYLTGEAFEEGFGMNTIKKLCMGRRVFKGDNLYTKGACYMAKYLKNEDDRAFLYFGEDTVEYSVFLKVYKDAKIQDLELVRAGTLWQRAYGKTMIILDEEEEIQLYFLNPFQPPEHEKENMRILTLEGMPYHKNKMGRFEINIHFTDARTCVAEIRDMGFGEFRPSSSRVWEKTIVLKEDR